MSRLCFIQAFRAEIKVSKLSRPPSDCPSGHHFLISPPKVDTWLLLSWHPISCCFLLHCCLATDSSSIPDEVTLRERDLTASPLWASNSSHVCPPGGVHMKAFPTSRQPWSVLVSDAFLSEIVLVRAGVWALIGARHTMDHHLLDRDHQPTPEPVLLLSSWKLICYSQLFYSSSFFSSVFLSSLILIACFLQSFTVSYTSTHKHQFCTSIIVGIFTDRIQDK